jgi:indoleamine 2,3-dioxygenase
LNVCLNTEEKSLICLQTSVVSKRPISNMLGPLNIVLEDFEVCRYGFLPATNPPRLSNSYYSKWEDAVASLPFLLNKKALRDAVNDMPVLSTLELLSLAEWQRAYLLLSFITHGYIWGGETPSEASTLNHQNHPVQMQDR